MKLFIVLAACLYAADATIKCVQGNTTSSTASDCTDASATKCSWPKFKEYSGFVDSTVKFACGACAGETKGSTCEECTSNSTVACNTLETGADFKCHSFTYNTSTKAFVMNANTTTCKRLKTTTISCNKPNGTATNLTYTDNGCGNCTSTHCETCTTDSCNKSNALRLVALFVPVIAILYHLF